MLLYPRSTARRPRSRPAYRDSASPVPPAAAHRHRHRHRRSECPRASRHRVPRAWDPRGRHGCAARPGSALPSARITARRLTPCPRATALRGRFARPRVPRPAARARLGGTPPIPGTEPVRARPAPCTDPRRPRAPPTTGTERARARPARAGAPVHRPGPFPYGVRTVRTPGVRARPAGADPRTDPCCPVRPVPVPYRVRRPRTGAQGPPWRGPGRDRGEPAGQRIRAGVQCSTGEERSLCPGRVRQRSGRGRAGEGRRPAARRDGPAA